MFFYKQIINDCKWFKKIGDKLEIYIFAPAYSITSSIPAIFNYNEFIKYFWKSCNKIYKEKFETSIFFLLFYNFLLF